MNHTQFIHVPRKLPVVRARKRSPAFWMRLPELTNNKAALSVAYGAHCPKCQGAAAKDWLAARETDLLPVPYYHVVFTLPALVADIAYPNKAVVYDILF